MKYKLKDIVTTETEEFFGTCELCEYMGTLAKDELIFEDENSKEYREINGGWDWGDYIIYWHFDNYVKFAAYIANREYPLPELDEYGDIDFYKIVNQMYHDYKDDVEQNTSND